MVHDHETGQNDYVDESYFSDIFRKEYSLQTNLDDQNTFIQMYMYIF